MVRELDELIAVERGVEKLVQAVFLRVAEEEEARFTPCDGRDEGIVVVVAVVDVGRVERKRAVCRLNRIVLRQAEERRIPLFRGALEQREIHGILFVVRAEDLPHRVRAHERRRGADVILVVMAEHEIVDALHAAALKRGADGIKIVLVGSVVHDRHAVHAYDDAVGFAGIENVQRECAAVRLRRGSAARAERKQRAKSQKRGKASFHGMYLPFLRRESRFTFSSAGSIIRIIERISEETPWSLS